MQKTIKKATIAISALIGISIGYSSTNPTFEGTYIPPTNNINQHSQMLVGDKKSSLPPKYLSVPDFQKCLSQKDMGTWKSWCLPESKPKGCPSESWDKLKYGQDSLPFCTQASEYQSTARVLDVARPSGDWSKYLNIKDNKMLEHILKRRCHFTGSLDATYSMDTNTKWCSNAGIGLVDRYSKDVSVMKKSHLTFKNNKFIVNQTITTGVNNEKTK